MIKLVKAKKNDWQEILKLEQASSSKLFFSLNVEDEVLDYISKSKVFFINLNGDNIGSLAFDKKIPSTAYIQGVNILPNFRRKGYAAKALQEIIKIIKKQGFKLANAYVHPHNIPSIQLFFKHGFVIDGWKENVHGDGEPRLLLVKNLEARIQEL